MLRKKKGEIEWLEFEIFSPYPEFKHGVFLRHGGLSAGNFASLNALSKTGDNPSTVIQNRQKISAALNVGALISSEHIHGKEVALVSRVLLPPSQADGLLTREKDLPLMVTHADCQGALFYDPVNQAFAAVHAGWRGQVQNIYAETVTKMQDFFGSKPEDLRVGISPSLGPENAEFKNFKTELPESFWPFQVRPTYFDLWAIAHHQLVTCGILPQNIQIASIDTYNHPEDFFSYRREKRKGSVEKITGCHATVACLQTL